MEFRRFGNDYVIRMDRGEEVLTTLKALCKAEGIRLASVNALGAADHAIVCIYDLKEKKYHNTELNEPMEIASLVGTVSTMEGRPYLHLHAALCGADSVARGGHILALRVSATCEMTLHVIDGEVDRRLSDEIGLNLFRF